jgi:hypothetical protein
VPDYLPPEPGGPEPDLGEPSPQPPPPPAPPPPPPQFAAPPQQHQQWAQPPPYAQPQQPWTWQPRQPPVPDNGAAVAGFVLAMSAIGLLVISAGLSSIVSIVCAALAIYYSHKGKQRVARGETPKNAGLAQAGFVSGIIVLVLSLLATAAWVLIIVLYATDDEFRRDFDEDFESATMVIQYIGAFLT